MSHYPFANRINIAKAVPVAKSTYGYFASPLYYPKHAIIRHAIVLMTTYTCPPKFRTFVPFPVSKDA